MGSFYGIMLTATGAADNAATDLFSNEWSVGNLYEIQGLVNVLGHVAVVVISAVGFGIVIFSILKNAISGLYVVNPPFWDKVDDLKNDAIQGTQGLVNDTIGKSNNVAAKKLGGMLTTILGYVPNIKALTDFDDSDGEVVDKKQYFIKSIPLLVAQIFIGTLIFMGYPTKIASWVGNGGTYIIDAVINNVDPVETVKKISDSIYVYSLASDDAQDPYEKHVNEFTREMMRVVTTQYSDMTKKSVQNTAVMLEQVIDSTFTSETIRNVLGVEEGYKVTCSAIHQTVPPTQSSSYKELGTNLFGSQASNGSISYRFFVNGVDLVTGSTKESSSDWFVLSVTCTPEAVENSSSASMIAFGGFSSNVSQDTNAQTIKVPINGLTFGNGDSQSEIKGTLGKTVTVDLVDAEGNITSSLQASIQSPSIGVTTGANASLVFSSAERDRIKEGLDNCAYWRVNLTGTWTKDIQEGKTKTTMRIQELRLVPNSSQASFALTNWPDVDGKTTAGVGIGDGFLKKGKLGSGGE